MATQDEVLKFLADLKVKANIWPIVFRDDRGKNAQTLADLEITPMQRETIVKELQVNDFSEGPIADTLYKTTGMWVFGKMVKQVEVYIKITMGEFGGNPICISFHTAEKAMTYPYKNNLL
ncbi:MAG: toxin [Bacteroidota bacterium]